MSSLFLRIYLSVAGVLLLAVVGALWLLAETFRDEAEDRLRMVIQPFVDELRQRLEEPPRNAFRRDSVLNWAKRSRPYPVEFAPLDASPLDGDEAVRLRAGDLVFAQNEEGRFGYAVATPYEIAIMGPLREEPSQGRRALALALLIILVTIGLAIYWLLRPLERRIQGLAEAAKRFGRGELGARAKEGGKDALDDLGGAFNWMADRIQGLIESQKDLLRAVSHELRTPLARLFFVLDDAVEAATPVEKNKCLNKIERSLNEMNELVDELLALAKLESDEARSAVEIVDTGAVLRDTAETAKDLRRALDIDLRCHNTQLEASRRFFKRAVRNLVANAVRHTQTGIWIADCIENGFYVLTVEDDGPGIPEEMRDRVFEPFYRVDESRTAKLGGSGLGLSIVAKVMEWHQGDVAVDDSPDHGGARFTLRFPYQGPDPEAP